MTKQFTKEEEKMIYKELYPGHDLGDKIVAIISLAAVLYGVIRYIF